MKLFQTNNLECRVCKTFRKDKNKLGGGVMFCVNVNISCRVLDVNFNVNDMEMIFPDFSLRNKKRLCARFYKPPYQNKQLSSRFDNITLLGEFTLRTGNWNLYTFMSCFDLESLNTAPAYFQSPNPIYLTLLLECPKSESIKGTPKIKFYNDCKNFDVKTFKTELFTVLSVSMIVDYLGFKDTFTNAPIKEKILRYNNNFEQL